MRFFTRFIFALFTLTIHSPLYADQVIRIMAANTTSGNGQNYNPGEGNRIFQGLDPDIVLVQEFNYLTNSTTNFRAWVDMNFGTTFSYFREPAGNIPNGIVSRFPILASGEWDDTTMTDRDYVWARIDIPGDKDLWAVSVHLSSGGGSSQRSTEAGQIRNAILNGLPETPTSPAFPPIPSADYLVIGGDFNTDNRNENCLTTLSSVVITAGPYPVDQNNNGNTNASRAKPYDWVMPDADLNALKTSLVIGSNTFTNGIVFDSRVYSPLAAVSPVMSGDSGATNMQHMAVMRAFLIPTNATNVPPTISDIAANSTLEDTATSALPFTIGDGETAAASLTVSGTSSNTGLVPAANIVFAGSGANRTVTVTPAANQNGSATITVTVSDGTASTSDTFVLTINAVNDTPVITGQQALSNPEETSRSIMLANLTVTDPDNTYPTGFVLLVQDGTNYSRSGNAITPALNFTGTLIVPVVVNDGVSNSNTFNLSVSVTAVNDTPTIGDIADTSTPEDTATFALSFTIGDVETAATSLTVSGTSSNTALVPNANIVFGGSGANRTVTVTPAANQNGSATITVTASDGTASTSDTFVLTVSPVNDAPTISMIMDQSIGVNTSTNSLQFTIGDLESPVSLMVAGASSNQPLLPDVNIIFGGSGENRSVTVSPESNQIGTTTITVSVSDGELTGIATFVVNVLGPDIAVEQPLNTNLASGGSAGFGNVAVGTDTSLTFYIKNTGTADLTGLTPNIAGNDAAMFTITAIPTAPVNGPNGTTAFTVRFSPTGVGLKTAVINITNNDPDENPYEINLTGTGVVPITDWRQTNFGSTANSGDGADLNDFDHDGLPNLIEYGFDLDPNQNSAGSIPGARIVGANLVLDFTEPPGVTGITYGAEWSATIESNDWQSIPDTGTPPRHIFSVAIGTRPEMFMRQKVTAP